MDGLRGSRKRAWVVVLTLVAAATVAACGERLEGGAACPILCPAQNVTVFDTVFDPIVIDTTISPFPPFGTEPTLVAATRGDTLDTRPVIRFDSLFAFYTTPSGDSAVTHVDSAYVQLKLDRAHSTFSAPVTLTIFNVDTVENDTTVVPEKLVFRPDRRVGSITLDTAKIIDSIRVPLDTAAVRSAVLDRTRLRLGIQATSPAAVMLQIISAEGGGAAALRYYAHKDTTIRPVSTAPNAKGLASATIREDFRDYLLVLRSPPPVTGPRLAAGGIPGQRVYLRFNVPPRILDSSTVLRATLLLTQLPDRSIDQRVPLTIYPQLVTAGVDVADVGRSALLIAPAGLGFDSVVVTPGDSGTVSVEVVNALRTWGIAEAKNSQRAIVLRSPDEALQPRRFLFFSSEASAAVRPRLRVNYSPRAKFGIP